MGLFITVFGTLLSLPVFLLMSLPITSLQAFVLHKYYMWFFLELTKAEINYLTMLMVVYTTRIFILDRKRIFERAEAKDRNILAYFSHLFTVVYNLFVLLFVGWVFKWLMN